ncbi:zinc ribbon domain-containing protein [Pseudescherichia sp.]|uniref:zinc ribbon domain-containing protein n=1 Tax=Pseudescherichia sp. TaxID=2055881 RepID=UPI0028AB71DD|nr:zinc ribbon domain-containing protein [Pseudescherichia sp.]
MSITCPDCHAELEPYNGVAHCKNCNKDIQLDALCPECHEPLEVLKACGAVDYFCQHGHGLISKKRVEFVPHQP